MSYDSPRDSKGGRQASRASGGAAHVLQHSTLRRAAAAAAAAALLIAAWLIWRHPRPHIRDFASLDPSHVPAAGGAAAAAAAALAAAPPLNSVTPLAGPRPLPFPPPAVNDALLRAVADACAARQETYIFVHGSEAAVVASADFASSVLARPCPPVDIMLAAEHRSIGLCTDAAIYIHLLGARLLPGPAALPLAAYAAACSPAATARMFLEAMHEEWLVPDRAQPDHAPPDHASQDHAPADHAPGAAPPGAAPPAVAGAGPASGGGGGGGRGGGGVHSSGGGGGSGGRGVHVFAPNFENAYASDRELHRRMDLVLCKVRRCVELFTPYLRDLNSSARVMFTGHTAIDPASAFTLPPPPPPPTACRGPLCGRGAPPPPPPRRQLSPPLEPDYNSFLHVRGKSELKHTAQLLECWARHPEWPNLTVVGPLPNPQIDLAATRRYKAAPNILLPRPGVPDGPNWPRFDPAPPAELARLQLAAGVHVCPSEREGYGLYLAEARAAGALVLAPDHPPMNEQVTPSTGLLIEVERAFSQPGPPVPALAQYGPISASVSPEAICRAVEKALALQPARRRALGLAARRAFHSERAALLQAMERARAAVDALLGGGPAAAAGRAGAGAVAPAAGGAAGGGGSAAAGRTGAGAPAGGAAARRGAAAGGGSGAGEGAPATTAAAAGGVRPALDGRGDGAAAKRAAGPAARRQGP